MSKTTKKKYVAKEVLDEYVLPEGRQEVVRVIASRGNNLHEVETASEEKFLVSMPTKFRKSVWIKRGDYVIVEPIEEGEKVKGEIITILYKDQIKYIKEEGKWPSAFGSAQQSSKKMIDDDMLPPSDDSDEEGIGNMVLNVNRQPMPYVDDDDEEESDSSEVDDG